MNHVWSILYVEDDEDYFFLVQEILSKTREHQVTLTQAGSFAEAENALRKKTFDAVLVDVTLGDRTGIDLIRQYSSIYPAPFILYTGREDDDETDTAAMQAGAAIYIPKDEVNPRSLERSIRYAIEQKRLQLELDASLHQKAAILESIQDGLYGLDRNWNFTYVNSRSAENVNRTPEEMIGRNIWQEFPLLIGSPLEQNLRRVMSERIPAKFEVPGRYTNQYLRISIFPSIEGVAVHWQDITSEKQNQEEARIAHQHALWMARFPDENPNPVARVSLDGIILYHNRVAGDPEIWSFRTDEKAPSHFAPLIEKVLSINGILETDLEIGPKIYSVSLVPFLSEGYINIYGRNITKRKEAEFALRTTLEQLHESELRFRTMADGTPVIIWVTNATGKIEFINKAYVEFFGVTLEQVRSGSWQMLVHPEDHEGYVDAYFEADRLRQPFRAQGRILRNDGEWRWVDSYGVPRFSENGEYLGMAGSSMDITEQKRLDAEQREQAIQLEVQRRLMAFREGERETIATELHDGPIQTLSAALFQMQNLQQDYPDPKLKDEFNQLRDIIRQCIQDLRISMRDLRPPALIHFGISKNIQYFIEDYRTRYPKLEFVLDLYEDHEDTLSEPIRLSLYRILQSGMNNIIFHSDATKVRISFRIDQNTYCLELSDNGKGFDTAITLEQLSSAGHFGLIGMKERALSIGADLEVFSRPSWGTTIRVTGQLPGR